MKGGEEREKRNLRYYTRKNFLTHPHAHTFQVFWRNIQNYGESGACTHSRRNVECLETKKFSYLAVDEEENEKFCNKRMRLRTVIAE